LRAGRFGEFDAQDEVAANNASLLELDNTCAGLGPGRGFEKAFVAPVRAAFVAFEE
jgi:hypothetical protein